MVYQLKDGIVFFYEDDQVIEVNLRNGVIEK